MRFTLYGIYQYDEGHLFDGVILPEGITKDYVINEILKRSGDLYVYYQVPLYMKMNIKIWFARNYDNFYRMIKALTAEYDPIENYNRHDWSLHEPREIIETQKGGKDVRTIKTELGSTTTNSKSAFDSSEFSPNEKDTTSGGDTSTDTNELGASETVTNSGDHEYKAHSHGNIGVTTNQQMIQQELELRKFDIYTEIARRFEREFIVDLY